MDGVHFLQKVFVAFSVKRSIFLEISREKYKNGSTCGDSDGFIRFVDDMGDGCPHQGVFRQVLLMISEECKRKQNSDGRCP